VGSIVKSPLGVSAELFIFSEVLYVYAWGVVVSYWLSPGAGHTCELYITTQEIERALTDGEGIAWRAGAGRCVDDLVHNLKYITEYLEHCVPDQYTQVFRRYIRKYHPEAAKEMESWSKD